MVIRESFMIFSRLNFKLRQLIANHPKEMKRNRLVTVNPTILVRLRC